MTNPTETGAIERLRNGWLCSSGERFVVLSISFAKAAIEREESPQRAAQMLDELLKSAPADVVRVIPPMSPAAVKIVMEADRLDPPEGKPIVVDDESKWVPVCPEAFRLLTGPLFWDLCALTPGTIDALMAIEDARRPQRPAA